MNSRQLIRWSLIAAALVMGLAAAPRSARAQSDQFQLSAVLQDGPYFLPDRWLPVRVLIHNRSDTPIEGQVVLPFNGQSQKVTFRLPVNVPPNASLSSTAYVFIPTPADPPATRGKQAQEAPALCIAELRNPGGAMIARCPILGRPVDDDPSGTADRVRVDRPFIISINGPARDTATLPDATIDTSEFAANFQSTNGYRLLAVPLSAGDAPRDALGYDAAAMVLLEGTDLDRLDVGQQQALIDYMTGGGAVVLADPAGAVDPGTTWLAPYLPVRRIGTRYADSITLTIGGSPAKHKFIAPVDLCEWTADPALTDARIVAGEPNYVHAAYQRVGLGRLIVTSFPISGLDPKDPAARAVWAKLFPATPSLRWEDSRLAATQGELLESMVGLKVPPWIVAASVVGAYVLIVLLIQLVARQGWRPTGFAVAILASILLAAGLLVFSMFRDRTVDLSVARIDVLDVQNGGVRNEAVTLLGPEQGDFPLGVVAGASLKQASGGESKPLDLMVSPLKADKAAIYPRRIERVWQAAGVLPGDVTLHAKALFDEKGVSLSVDNHVGAISSPVVIGENGRFALPSLTAGVSTVRVDDGVPNQPALQLDAEQLRRRILDAAFLSNGPQRAGAATSVTESITLAGWLNDAPPPLLQLPAGQTPKVIKSNTLVRTPVQIMPTPVGGKVHISRAFTQVINAAMGSMPYDQSSRQWLDQFMGQEFLVGFAFPSGIGHVKTTHVKVELTASAPQQTITLRRGQVSGGRIFSNPTAPIIGAWSQQIGTNSAEFDVEAGDVDANGWVWILVTVDGPPGGQARWHFQDFAVSYDGVVDGDPVAPVIPKPDPIIAAPAKPKAQPKKAAAPSTKPAKKPATKPATKKSETKTEPKPEAQPN